MQKHNVKYLSIIWLTVNKAVRTNLSKKHWVNMGNISALACFVIPDSCGSAGGALSLWMKIEECPDETGVMSSLISEFSEGFLIACDNGALM